MLVIIFTFFLTSDNEVNGSSYLHFVQDDAKCQQRKGNPWILHAGRQTDMHTSVVYIVVAQNQ